LKFYVVYGELKIYTAFNGLKNYMGERTDIACCMWRAETLHGIQGAEKHKKCRFKKKKSILYRGLILYMGYTVQTVLKI